MVDLLTGKSKVHQFQICCARTKYPSEIHKMWTIIVRAAIDNRAVNSALLSMLEFKEVQVFAQRAQSICTVKNELYVRLKHSSCTG